MSWMANLLFVLWEVKEELQKGDLSKRKISSSTSHKTNKRFAIHDIRHCSLQVRSSCLDWYYIGKTNRKESAASLTLARQRASTWIARKDRNNNVGLYQTPNSISTDLDFESDAELAWTSL